MLSLTAIRSAAAIRCSSVTNARWAAGTVRMYSDKPGSAGATAQSTTFKNREQAQEAHYIKQQEADKIRKLQESIKKQREELNNLEKHVNEVAGSSKK